jgi:hypothetical protein
MEFNIKVRMNGADVQVEHPAFMPQSEELASILEAIAMLCRDQLTTP